jgi:hypothetical protein
MALLAGNKATKQHTKFSGMYELQRDRETDIERRRNRRRKRRNWRRRKSRTGGRMKDS